MKTTKKKMVRYQSYTYQRKKNRTAAKSHQQKDETSCTAGKIETMILHDVSIIDHLNDKQKSQHLIQPTQQTMKARKKDVLMGKCCLPIDNYFTLLRVILVLCEMRIGTVGTSCFQTGWPPEICYDMMQQESNVNDFC
eukprot:2500796-Ditylum_brightwellii.AAC.1